MKFVYSGPYREFRGYVFANGKPVTVLDKATQLALAKEPDFKEVTDGTQETEAAPKVLEQARPILRLRRK